MLADAPVIPGSGFRPGKALGGVMLVGALQGSDNVLVSNQHAREPQHRIRIGAIAVQRHHQHGVAVEPVWNVQEIAAIEGSRESVVLGCMEVH